MFVCLLVFFLFRESRTSGFGSETTRAGSGDFDVSSTANCGDISSGTAFYLFCAIVSNVSILSDEYNDTLKMITIVFHKLKKWNQQQ